MIVPITINSPDADKILAVVKARLKKDNITVLFAKKTRFNTYELVTKENLSQQQINQIRQHIKAISVNHKTRNIKDFDLLQIHKLTEKQIGNHIEKSVVDLDSAKSFLKKICLFQKWLYMRMIENE